MKTTVVTEGPTDARIIQGALGDRDGVKVIPASGRSEADSYARSVLAVTDASVVLVVDADTVDEPAQQERKAFHEASLGQIAAQSRWSVVVIAPTVEAVLFQGPGVAKRLFGDLTIEQSVAARYVPKQVATEALKGTPLLDALSKLGERDWQELRNLPPMRRILECVDASMSNGLHPALP